MIKKILLSASLLPAIATGIYAFPVLADDITVVNENWAEVGNGVFVVASTGGNSAGGGSGGSGGDGGSVVDSDDDNMGGNGGSGGNGGIGGHILTGNAVAGAAVVNVVNTNNTEIDDCACDDQDHHDDWDEILVFNSNGGYVGNGVLVAGDTGSNGSGGGSGGSGGDGGSVVDSDDDNMGGNGGSTGGNGGWGGGVTTGNATAGASITNLVNTNITRILH